jgi:hypothetical protein
LAAEALVKLDRNDFLIGGAIFLVSAITALLLFFLSTPNWVMAPGRMIPGHANISCGECHKPAPGTARQQVQANVDHWAGLRGKGAWFGNLPVAGAACASCHERKADTHPTYRFREPRFLDAVNRLDARDCLSCHAEHRDRRVLAKADQCELCHDKLIVKNDPLDVSHATLIAKADWPSCLGCHDYHGNHKRKAQTTFNARFSRAAIDAYLANGPSPYGEAKKEKGKQP